MVKQYEILQLNSNIDEAVDLLFGGYDYICSKVNDLDTLLKLYKIVWEDEIECNENVVVTLEELFRIFNVEHPDNFKGHSLSVSDIVHINDSYWICDRYGWKELDKTLS